MLNKSLPINPKYFCENCQYKTNNKKDYAKHILTRKHEYLTVFNKNLTNKSQKSQEHICEYCNKIYKSRVGLWYHFKKCNNDKITLDKNNIDCFDNTENDENIKSELNYQNINYNDNNIIMMLLNQNNQLQQQIIELSKNNNQNINSNNVNNVNNSNNKSFNLNLFLNETCKNAMNITDFINSIQLNLTDLEKVGELGYVEGISKIIIDNLKLLDITERPFHCSDLKREVMYVKDKDKWEKDNEQNTKIKNVINSVTSKNISLIPKWKKENPDCTNINSNKSTKINKMIMEVMETDKSKDEKIIKNIAKEITINKF